MFAKVFCFIFWSLEPVFGLGLFNKSKSKTVVSNITEVQNVGVSTGEGSTALTAVEGSTVNVLDGGAIGEAFDFAGQALDQSFDFSADAFDEALSFSRESLGLVEQTVGSAQRSFEKSLQQTLNTLDESQTGGARRLLIFGGIALVSFVAFAFFTR